MPGLLITPSQFFFNLEGNLKADFVGWQLICRDTDKRTVFCGEIAGSTALRKEDETFSVNLKWAAENNQGHGWTKRQPGPVAILMNGCLGTSLESGGCRFNPGMSNPTEFDLCPPGFMEQGAEQLIWEQARLASR